MRSALRHGGQVALPPQSDGRLRAELPALQLDFIIFGGPQGHADRPERPAEGRPQTKGLPHNFVQTW